MAMATPLLGRGDSADQQGAKKKVPTDLHFLGQPHSGPMIEVAGGIAKDIASDPKTGDDGKGRFRVALCNQAYDSGVHEWGFRMVETGKVLLGVVKASAGVDGTWREGNKKGLHSSADAWVICLPSDDAVVNKWHNNRFSDSGFHGISKGGICGIRLDCDARTLTFTCNGTESEQAIFEDLPEGEGFIPVVAFGGDHVRGATIEIVEEAPTAEASIDKAERDKIGIGFKDKNGPKAVTAYAKEVRHLSQTSAFLKTAKIRESIHQLDSIIQKVQDCSSRAAHVGSVEALSLIFGLKRQLSGSPGLSTWILKSLTKVVEKRLGLCEPQLIKQMTKTWKKLATGKFEDIDAKLWARSIVSPHAKSVADKAEKFQEGSVRFTQWFAKQIHTMMLKQYGNNTILAWFIWGLIRNVNRGKVGFLDQIGTMDILARSDGMLAWSSLGWSAMEWQRQGGLDVAHFGGEAADSTFQWHMHELVSLDLPRLSGELIDLRSEMMEQVEKIAAMQAKGLALGVSVSITGFQLLAKVLAGTPDQPSCTCSLNGTLV